MHLNMNKIGVIKRVLILSDHKEKIDNGNTIMTCDAVGNVGDDDILSINVTERHDCHRFYPV